MKLLFAILSLIVVSTVSTSAQMAKWTYETSKDEMRNIVIRQAKLRSENTVDLASPYDGADNYAYLVFVRNPNPAVRVGLVVDRGQFVCSESMNGKIDVQFDGGLIAETSCEEAKNGASNVVLLPAEVLDMRIGIAKRLVLEAQFYGSGRKQMVFDVAGLEW